MSGDSPEDHTKLTEREGVYTGGSGVKLHYRTHRMEEAPFRAVIAVIDAPEDRGRLYARFVQLLVPTGYVLYGSAHQEHRRVPGQPGFLEEWNDLYQELDAFITLVRSHEPDAPLFLAGGQVAGQLVMTYALHHPQKLQGVIAYHPTMHRPSGRPSLVSIAKFLSRIWPAFRPPDTVDLMVHSETTERDAGLSPEMLAAPPAHLAVSEATASELAIPVLVVEGEAPVSPDVRSDNLQAPQSRRGSLLEVEPWLDEVLKTSST